jgi:hypothetical protein
MKNSRGNILYYGNHINYIFAIRGGEPADLLEYAERLAVACAAR